MKKYAFGLFALALAVGVSSFTSSRAIDTWFSYDLTTNTNAFDPQSYSLVGDTEPSNPAGNTVVNAIKVDQATEIYTSGTNLDKPKVDVVSSSLRTAIQSAINTHTEASGRVTLK